MRWDRRAGMVAALVLAMVVIVAGCGGSSTTEGGGVGEGGVGVLSLDVTGGPRCGYQNVTISGVGFTEVSGVIFGSAEATGFSVVDATRIVALTPPGELGEVVDVTVRTEAGAATLPAAYTYWDYDLELSKGSRSVTHTLNELKVMPSVTGFWGAVNDRPYATNHYKGVPLLTLLDEVGGCGPGESIVVTSADGFSTTYTAGELKAMAEGTCPMWNTNGATVISDDRFAQLVVAYEIDGGALKPGKGPFRVVVMTTADDRLSQGPWNPALVVSAKVVSR